jgi:hypothetical protein
MRCQGSKRGAVPCRRSAEGPWLTCTYHRDQEPFIRDCAAFDVIRELWEWIVELDPNTDAAAIEYLRPSATPAMRRYVQHLGRAAA